MVCSHSLAGVAPGEALKAEATELAPGAIGAGPPTAIKIRVVSTGRRRGPFCKEYPLLLVELPSGGFGPYNAKIAGRPAGAQNGLLTDGFPQRWAGAIEESLHPATLTSRIVIFAYGFANRRTGRRHPGDTLGDVYITALVASL